MTSPKADGVTTVVRSFVCIMVLYGDVACFTTQRVNLNVVYVVISPILRVFDDKTLYILYFTKSLNKCRSINITDICYNLYNLCFAGNKTDRDDREIPIKVGEEFAKQQGMYFLETSAKASDNVERLFYDIAAELIEQARSKEMPRSDTGGTLSGVAGGSGGCTGSGGSGISNLSARSNQLLGQANCCGGGGGEAKDT